MLANCCELILLIVLLLVILMLFATLSLWIVIKKQCDCNNKVQTDKEMPDWYPAMEKWFPIKIFGWGYMNEK